MSMIQFVPNDAELLLGSFKYSLRDCTKKLEIYKNVDLSDEESHTFEAYQELLNTTRRYAEMVMFLKKIIEDRK